MSEPESGRVVRQLRHDVDDVYELLTDIQQVLGRHGDRLHRLDSRLDGVDTRLEGIEDVQRQILDFLRGGPSRGEQ